MRNLEALSTALASWPATVPDAKKTPDTSTEGGREIKKDRMKRRSRSARERLSSWDGTAARRASWKYWWRRVALAGLGVRCTSSTTVPRVVDEDRDDR